jgi:type II secretory ATPase GspE/PulE/Tfp pilus assembly ATPase PilB-like protein
VIAEILELDEDFEKALSLNEKNELKKIASTKNFFSMRDHAQHKVQKGETTESEVFRVLGR